MRRGVLLILVVVLCAPPTAGATKIRLKRVGRFDAPVYVTAPPQDRHRVFVVEKGGLVREVRRGRVLARPFLDIRSRVLNSDEQGLLSIAFDPEYRTNHLLYAFFTAKDGTQHVEEFYARSANHVDAGTARVVLIEDDPVENNNGGQLQFGPDGDLYIANGDGGGEENGPPDVLGNGQNLGTVFGKILRIDPHGDGPGQYSIPASNPFQASGQAPEAYLYGVRNPWRFSFDAKTGAMIIGDVGRGQEEEIDYFKRGHARGANLGWPVYEGRDHLEPSETAKDPVFPVMQFSHGPSIFYCAITGGYVSRDPKVKATYGRYLFGDYCLGEVRIAKLRRPRSTSHQTGLKVPSLVSFGEDARHRVYVVSFTGRVSRIVAAR